MRILLTRHFSHVNKTKREVRGAPKGQCKLPNKNINPLASISLPALRLPRMDFISSSLEWIQAFILI